MNRIGQLISWSTPSAPHLFTGVCTGYSYDDQVQRTLDRDESGDNRAAILAGRKSALSFDAKVTEESTDFLDLSAGPQLIVSGISGGVIVALRAVEHWTLNQAKIASAQATHYPDMTQASPVPAGTDLDAFTPDQSALSGIVRPGGTLIYSTFGMTQAAGVLHDVELAQSLAFTEDDLSPAGTYLGGASHGYMRELKLMILAKSTRPAVDSVLVLTGGPAHSADYRIDSSKEAWATERGKMYEVSAFWIPPFTTGG